MNTGHWEVKYEGEEWMEAVEWLAYSKLSSNTFTYLKSHPSEIISDRYGVSFRWVSHLL